MRRCPVCRNPLSDQATSCPRCMSNLDDDQDNIRQNKPGKILEPELLDPASPSGSKDDPSAYRFDNRQFTKIFVTSFAGGNARGSGCTPMLLTLVFALGVFLAYGFLAMLGFIFFSAVLGVLSFMLTILQLFNRRHVTPWIFYILTWAMSWGLVAWLSG